ncbi:MAG: sugar transferase [Candidatus Omnitrophica bacterium]|nr:sugar transferase [Candidatus Omnitrophota bacterium]
MIKHSRKLIIKLFYIGVDIGLITAAIYIACLLRQTTLALPVTLHEIFFDPFNEYRFLFGFWLVITVLQLNRRELHKTQREQLEGIEIGQVIQAVIYAAITMLAVIFIFRFSEFPRSIFVIGTILNIIFLSLWRSLKRQFVMYLVSKGYNNFNAIIIGAGQVGMTLAQEIQNRPGLGIHLVGFLDDSRSEEAAVAGLPPILGKVADFPKYAHEEFVQQVFITTYPDNRDFLRLLVQARDMGIAIRVVPQGFELISGELAKYTIGIVPILEYTDGVRYKEHAAKRVFDVAAALILVAVLSPVLAATALWVKLSSPGPVFYFSPRYGRGGRKFGMMKFRTMVADADKQLDKVLCQKDVDGPIFKIKNDPRITTAGAFLRKYSIDELPQLFNVIKGDMSLVGPRPLLVEYFGKHDHLQVQRLGVRPGITGLWQIRGRSDVSSSRLMRWDLWYINNWSFWLDLNILWQTIPVVFKGRGAY